MEKIGTQRWVLFFIWGFGSGNMGWQVEKLLLFIFVQVHAFVFWGWGGFQNNPPTTTTTPKPPSKHPSNENVFIIFLCFFY